MIVNASDADIDSACVQITQLEQELFGRGAWTEGMVRAELCGDNRTYVFEIDEQQHIHGYAGFWFDGDDAELMTLGVSKGFQNRGIATNMLNTLLSKAQRQGAQRMLLEVRVDNIAAIALYEHFAFERIGLRKRYYQPENVDAYTMAVDLNRRTIGFVSSTHQTQEQLRIFHDESVRLKPSDTAQDCRKGRI